MLAVSLFHQTKAITHFLKTYYASSLDIRGIIILLFVGGGSRLLVCIHFISTSSITAFNIFPKCIHDTLTLKFFFIKVWLLSFLNKKSSTLIK